MSVINKFEPIDNTGTYRATFSTTTATIAFPTQQNRSVNRYRVQLKVTGTPGSVALKRTVSGSGYTGSDLQTGYYYTDDAPTTAVSTALTAAALFTVLCDGDDVYFSFTASSGSFEVTVRPVIG